MTSMAYLCDGSSQSLLDPSKPLESRDLNTVTDRQRTCDVVFKLVDKHTIPNFFKLAEYDTRQLGIPDVRDVAGI